MAAVLSSSIGQVASWRRGHVQYAQAEAQRGIQMLRRDRQMMEELEGQLAESRDLTGKAKRLRSEVIQYGQHLKSALAISAKGTGIVEDAYQKLLKEDAEREAEANQAATELAAQRDAMDVRLGQLEVLLGTYRERLGLDLSSHGSKACQLAFSLLDAASPERQFVVTLSLDESGRYQALSCSPVVPELPRLLSDLNEAAISSQAAFSSFICALRRSFQKVANDTERMSMPLASLK